jgi:ubiquinone/menaquinone biosynthesis C-methylase UbiE
MTIFDSYASYYDLLYRDKDYAAEAEFINQLLQQHALSPQSILELGCGTGAHAVVLGSQGYQVHGVDLSFQMLDRARSRLSKLPSEQASQISFSHGDIREIQLDKTFDAVLSLFHVVSYQTTNDDLKAVFNTAKRHLKKGGIFIFDCWYGPAVLSDRPTVRLKRMKDDRISVARIAEPLLHPNDNLVDVNYQIFVTDKVSGSVEEFQETHKMRYLFKSEIDFLFSELGFTPVTEAEWMTNNVPGFNTWGVYFVGRA